MPKKLLPWLLLLAPMNACICDPPALQDTPSPNVVVVDEAGNKAGTPPLVIAFGDVEIGQPSRKRVTIKNAGTANLTLQRVGPLVDASDAVCPVSSAEFQYPPVSSSQRVEIAPGAERTVEIAYRPQDGGSDCAIMEVKSDDQDEPSLRVYFTARGSAARFCADEATLDFGDVVIGQRATKMTRVGNCGIRPLTLQSVMTASSFPPFELVTSFTGTRTLMPGEMLPVEVAFAPTMPARYGGVGATAEPGVILFTTDVSVGSLTLLGRGVTPPACNLSVAPTAINFAQVATGMTATRQVLLGNAGDAPCTVQSITRVDGSDMFSVASGGAPPAVTVAPAQTVLVSIQFAPTAEGLQRATFRITSDNPTAATQDVTVEGNQPPPEGCYLEADPSFINWGIVATGTTFPRQVALHNAGTEDCSLKEVRIPNGAPEFSSGVSALPFIGTIIPSGDTFMATINFRAATPGPRNGRAQFAYKALGFGGTTLTLDVDLAANPQAPAICVMPDPMDFGSVPINATVNRTLTISSCGAAPLKLRGLHLASGTSSSFSIPTLPMLPQALPPGQSVTVEVSYRPTQAAGDLGVLAVMSDDINTPTANVRLLGNASGLCPPLMRCSPETLEFGNSQSGFPDTRTVVCRNYGTQTVTITSAMVAPAGTFAVSGQLPASLAAGDAITLQVTLTGVVLGAATATLTVGSNACESNQAIQLEATVIPGVLPACLSPSSFSPRQEWAWTSSTNHPNKDQVWVTPVVINLNDDNGDGVISGEDIPDVIFSTFDGRDFNVNPMSSNILAPVPAVVRAVSGDDGRELWTVMPDEYRVQSEAGLAAGDIDGDNKPDIIGSKYLLLMGEPLIPGGPATGLYVRGNLICFNNDGTLKWISDDWTGSKDEMEDGGAPSIADLDQDGFAEIIWRNQVFDHEGHLKWAGTKRSGSAGHGALSVAVDLNGDGKLDVAAGFTAYKGDGTILWDRSDLMFDGLPAVADFEGDGKPEVVVHDGKLHILNGEDGTNAYPDILLPYPQTACGEGNADDCETPIPTAVALADFDGDGHPEIAVSNRSLLLVFEANGTELWRVPIADYTGAAGPSAFDFEGDGIAEVVYADEQNAFALRGNNGMNIYTSPRSSRTIFEYPVVVDVDHDGHANMVVVENEPLLRSAKGIKMLSNTTGNWANANPVWNQHAYHVTNVSPSGAIPRVEAAHYLGNPATNGFRTQGQRCQ